MNNDAAVAALAALAFDTRLRAVQTLATVSPDGLPAGELSRRLGVPQNTLSDHLAALTRAGVVQAERQSRSIIYRLNVDGLDAIIGFLTEICARPKAA